MIQVLMLIDNVNDSDNLCECNMLAILASLT
jgi:hypothetical protein